MDFYKILLPDIKPGYTINKIGEIKNRHGRIIKPYLNRGGYHVIKLPILTGRKMFSIHRLVACTFIERYKGKNVVNHIDGNKLNNTIDNLEWCTQAENIFHALGKKSNDKNISENIHVVVFLHNNGFRYSDINKLIPLSEAYFYRIINIKKNQKLAM